MASPIPKEGVTLALLQRLRDIVAHTNPEWTTTEVCVNLIKPWTEDKRCSLASLLKSDYTNKEHPDLQLTYDQSCGSHANMFCSHAWRYKFCHVVESLETFILNDVKSTGNAIVWFDLAINDQWNASSLPFEWWCETFQNSIKEIGHTVLVLSPWSDPIPLTRAWCLWEIHSTVTTTSRLSIAIGTDDKKNFHHTLRSDFRSIIKSLCEISVEKSEAYFPADRDKILAAVRSSEGGCHGINNEIMKQMRLWLRCSAKDAISLVYEDSDALAALPEDELIDVLRDAHVYALLVQEHGEVQLAIDLYRILLMKKEALLGKAHIETAKTLINMATCLDILNLSEDALSVLNQALTVYEEECGENSREMLSTLANKAALLKNLKRDDEAWVILSDILPHQEALLGKDHHETLSTVFTMAMILNKKEQVDEALVYYNRRIEALERTEGPNHIDFLNTKRAVAGMLLRSPNPDSQAQALAILQAILPGFVKVIGWMHNDTLQVALNIALLLWLHANDLTASLELHQTCVVHLRKLHKNEEGAGGVILRAMENIAAIYTEQGGVHLQDGVDVYKQVISLRERSDPLWVQRSTSQVVEWLDAVYVTLDRAGDCLALREKLYKAHEHNLGRVHKFVIRYAYNIGMLHLNLKNLNEGLQYFKLALENADCVECKDDSSHFVDAITYAKAVDTVLCRLHKYNERIEILEKIVEYAEQCQEGNIAKKEELTKDARDGLCKGQEWLVTHVQLEKLKGSYPSEVVHNCHSHPLVFAIHLNEFSCDVCCSKKDDKTSSETEEGLVLVSEQPHISYRCEQCDFDVHMECVSVLRLDRSTK